MFTNLGFQVHKNTNPCLNNFLYFLNKRKKKKKGKEGRERGRN